MPINTHEIRVDIDELIPVGTIFQTIVSHP